MISTPQRVGGCSLVRRYHCVGTTLASYTMITQLHLRPWRIFCNKRVECKLSVTLNLWPSHSGQMLCCFPESREVKTIRSDAEWPIKSIYDRHSSVWQLALCTLACVRQRFIVFPLFCYLSFQRFFLFWTSSLHFLIIKTREKCHFRAHQLERPADWKQMWYTVLLEHIICDLLCFGMTICYF